MLTNARLMPWLILMLAGLPWGGTFVLTIIAVERGDHPLGIGFWQALSGFVMLLGYNALRGKMLFPINRFYLTFYVVCGVLGTAMPTVLFLYAAEHVSAGVLSIATATVPILTFAAAYLWRLEGFSWLRLFGLLLGVIAIGMITVPETGLPDPSAWPWVLVAVCAASCYAIENNIIGKYLSPDEDVFVILAGMLFASTLLIVPVMIALDVAMVPAWPLEAVEWSILAMAAINVLSYGLFIYLVGLSGPVFASQMGYVVTLSGIAWGILVFAEEHSLWFWWALMIMMVGLTLVRPREDATET